jgi:uncharacterized lipoprotein YbaY
MVLLAAFVGLAPSVLAQGFDRSRDFGGGWQPVNPVSIPASPLPGAPPSAWPSTTGVASPPPLLGSSQSGYVPSWNAQPNAWRIGVAIENTEAGVTLTDVERGSPADRAGLVRGDSIVSVKGYQVGYVDGSLFDLGDELQRRTDAQGRVQLLSYDSRNRRLRPVPVQLTQSSSGGVAGQILCNERITLSPQAALTVRLRDVTYTSWQNVEVGKQVIPNPPHPPIPFAIQVDPASFYPDHRYAIDAWLEDRGQIVLQSSAPVTVDPRSTSTPLRVTLIRTGASQPPATTYAVGQLEQIAQWYRQYLGRSASTQELAAWQAHLQAGRSPQEILAFILGSSEFYDRSGNQRDRYLSDVYRVLNGRAPTSYDLQQYVDRFSQYGGARTQFVRDLLRVTPDSQLP